MQIRRNIKNKLVYKVNRWSYKLISIFLYTVVDGHSIHIYASVDNV